jgi:hypothetical protein
VHSYRTLEQALTNCALYLEVDGMLDLRPNTDSEERATLLTLPPILQFDLHRKTVRTWAGSRVVIVFILLANV